MLSAGNPCCFGCNAVWFTWFPWPFSSSHSRNVYHKGGLDVGSGLSKDRLITRAVMVFPVLIWQGGWSLPCRLKIPHIDEEECLFNMYPQCLAATFCTTGAQLIFGEEMNTNIYKDNIMNERVESASL